MKKIGIIGAGKIVPFHIDALRESGFIVSAISATPGSKNVRILAREFKIPRVFDDTLQLVHSDIDGILIAVSQESLLSVLEDALPSNKKILIEKPVFLDANKSVMDHRFIDNVMVAYNRRFYATVELLQNRISNSQYGSFHFYIPELSSSPNPSKKSILNTLRGNTVHYFDLINFIFKSKERRIQILDTGSVFEHFHKLVFIDCGNVKGILHITFGSPGNYRLEFQNGSILSSLSPIETYREFDSMIVQEPDAKNPTRRYTPVNSAYCFSPISEDNRFKPGFLAQSNEFFRFVNGQALMKGATLHDASQAANVSALISNGL